MTCRGALDLSFRLCPKEPATYNRSPWASVPSSVTYIIAESLAALRPCALRVPPCLRCVHMWVWVLVYVHRYTNLLCILSPNSSFRLKVHLCVLGVRGGESQEHPKPQLNLTWGVGLGQPSLHLDFGGGEERGRGGQNRQGTVLLQALRAGLWELQEEPCISTAWGLGGVPCSDHLRAWPLLLAPCWPQFPHL